MKQFILVLILLLQMVRSTGQISSKVDKLYSLKSIEAGLHGIGFTYTPRIANKITLDLSLGAGGGYYVAEKEIKYHWNLLDPAVYFSVTPKYYYNRSKRFEKGKNNSSNAGNYIGLRVKYTSRGIAENSDVYDALLTNIHWGIQRAIGKKWIFNSHVGVGYATDATDLQNTSGTIYPALEFKFSYSL